MKKYLIILLSVILAVFFAGCGAWSQWDPGRYKDDGDGKYEDPNDPDITPGNPGVDPGPGEVTGVTFTVKLNRRKENGDLEDFAPMPGLGLKARWVGEDGIYEASFDAMGVARIVLDGDYTVSISNLPDDYAYNPNGLEVNNRNPNIIIELMNLYTHTYPQGRGLYVSNSTESCISISEFGAYKAILTGPQAAMHYEFKPEIAGMFLVESMVDATVNEVNPNALVMTDGQKESKPDNKWVPVKDGGASNTTTKNFRFQYQIGKDYIGNVMTFRITANTIRTLYDEDHPVEVIFKVTYLGEYEEYKTMTANGPFYYGDTPTGTWEWSYRNVANGNVISDNTFITDGTNGIPMRFRLNWEDVDGNGRYTPLEWINDTNGNGKFDKGDEWQDLNGNGKFDWEDKNGNGKFDPGEQIDRWNDTNGNGALDEGDEWWDIDGDGDCGMDTGDGFYHWYDKAKYADSDGWGPLLWAKIWSENSAFDTNNANTVQVFITTDDKRNYYNFWAEYKKYAKDNAHPVNKEIMEAIQFLMVANKYFYDGKGSAERGSVVIGSYTDSMFLALCGYYL